LSLPTAPNLPVDETLAKADALFKQREDISKLRDAVNLVAQVRNPDNRNFDVEAAFAKYNCFLGRQTTDETEKQKAFDAGEASAQIASRLQPEKPDGYFWYGANLGEESKMSPVTVGIKAVDDIREAMNKVVEIDPGFQGASAYDILAQVELNTRLMGGKAEKAVEYLEKAISIEKNNTYLYVHLAQAYLAVKQPEKAKQQLNHALTMKPDPDYIPEHKAAVEEAKKMLATKF
jgi:tetratricopeptide (TPR) repeat protein